MARFVKSEKGYEASVTADWSAVKKGIKKVRSEATTPKKVPTSVALDPKFVSDLKKEAQQRGIPYQVLMRMFIIEGFQRMKKAG